MNIFQGNRIKKNPSHLSLIISSIHLKTLYLKIFFILEEKNLLKWTEKKCKTSYPFLLKTKTEVNKLVLSYKMSILK